MFFVNVFYCVNNEVFHKTEFVNKKYQINELCQSYYDAYLEKCKLHFQITLPTYNFYDTLSYKDNHMFNLDYGLIKSMQPEIEEDKYESEDESEEEENMLR
jgi:hypothetical protein